jgi:hypothetical protein
MLESMTLDLTGWQEVRRDARGIVYRDASGGAMMLSSSSVRPEIPTSFERDAWLAHARDVARPGGIVSVDPRTIHGLPAMELIYKRQHERGFYYTGLLFMERAGNHHRVVVSWQEGPMTGAREAVLMSRLLQEGRIRLPKGRPPPGGAPLEGFVADPYDRAYTGPILRSLSDDEQYDALFPLHPLSRVRSQLRIASETIRFS